MTNPIRPRALSFAQVTAVLLLVLAVVLGTAGSAAAQRRPRDERVRSVLRAARNAIGTPYRYGGTSLSGGFDCSGLTRWAWSKGGHRLPHSSRQQYRVLRQHPGRRHLRPGDLLFFYRPISHVAIYMGKGYMIEAPHAGARVRRVHVYWHSFTAAGRPA
jgi:cell wall-associated NlpC family hydrolase